MVCCLNLFWRAVSISSLNCSNVEQSFRMDLISDVFQKIRGSPYTCLIFHIMHPIAFFRIKAIYL
jgi:hypothetical protein